MTTHLIMEAGRIEEIARAFEDLEVLTIDGIVTATNLRIEEFAAIVGECIASRKMAEKGGARINMRGNTEAAGIAGFYRRLKWKFACEIGSPQTEMTENELKESARRVTGQVMSKIAEDFEQLNHEMRMREAERAARNEQPEVSGEPN